MKVFYEERLAYHFGLPRRCDNGNNVVLSVRSEGKRRPAIELRNQFTFVCRPRLAVGKTTPHISLFGKGCVGTAESENLSMCGNFKRENREIRPARSARAIMRRKHFGGQGTTQWEACHER